MAQMISQMLKLRTALMSHTHPVGNPVATFPSPGLIGENIDELPKDIQELYNLINEMILGAIDELNSIKIPNKDKDILSKNVFTS